jgi:membrane protease YdiL (CAAX protease family)
MEAVQERLVSQLEALAYLTVLCIGISLIAWRLGFYQMPRDYFPSRGLLSIRNIFEIFLILLIIHTLIIPLLLIGWTVLQTGSAEFNLAKLDAKTQGWFNLVAIGLSALGVGGYCLLNKESFGKKVWGEEGFQGGVKGIADFLLGAATWLVCFPIVAWLGQSLSILLPFLYRGPHAEQVAVKHLKGTFSDPVLFWVTVAAIISVVPILEELLFRGFIQTWLKGNFGRVKAILATSTLFALFHFSSTQGTNNVELLASLFVLSCFLGFIFERQNSLWAPIGLHATFNALSVVMIISGWAGTEKTV